MLCCRVRRHPAGCVDQPCLVDYSEDELIEIESGNWIPNPVTAAEAGPEGGEEKD